MKIRNGFVSNSSSSSFCIVGVDINDWKLEEKHESIRKLRDILIPEGKEIWEVYTDGWGGEYILGDNLTAHGSDGNLYYLGMPAVDFWRDGMSFKELAEVCRKTIKEKYGVDVPIDEFDIYYGETSTG